MSFLPFGLVLAVTVGYMYYKRSGQISSRDAEEHLKNGAMVIDVRSPREFESGHLMQAQNMPLDRIEMLIASMVRDKNKWLLLHCSTGVRSGMAKKKLESLGFKNVFNLGSYDRARKIITGR
jgi:rhodanese-related sulfurtransferase